MSLVNDMLRDLDARRRDAPARGVGSEKLVPAAERATHKKRGRFGVLATLLAFVFVGLLALYLILIGRGSGQIAAPVQRVPMAESPAGSDAVLTDAELIAQAAAAAAQSVAEESAQALSRLELRLQQLESQNQALLSAQQPGRVISEGQDNTLSAQAQQPAQAPDRSTASAAGQPVNQPFSQQWADAPALPVDEPIVPQARPENNSVASTTRSPRELSFEDRDRQQVQMALQQWASGQQLTALQTLDSFAHENPDAHYTRETLAKLLLQQGESERAMQAVELGLALSPNNNAYRKIKARLLVADGRAPEAVVLLADMAPAVASDSEYHDLLASSYLANQQYDFAEQVYRVLLTQNAEEGRWWYGLAAAFDAQGLTQDAATSYERALQLPDLTAGLRQASQQRLQLIRPSSAAR